LDACGDYAKPKHHEHEVNGTSVSAGDSELALTSSAPASADNDESKDRQVILETLYCLLLKIEIFLTHFITRTQDNNDDAGGDVPATLLSSSSSPSLSSSIFDTSPNEKQSHSSTSDEVLASLSDGRPNIAVELNAEFNEVASDEVS